MDNTFAKRLINARKMRCISQRDLCRMVEGKVSPTAIAKYEKGLMMPSSDDRVRGQVPEPSKYNYEMARKARTHSDSGVYHAYCSPDEFEPSPEY